MKLLKNLLTLTCLLATSTAFNMTVNPTTYPISPFTKAIQNNDIPALERLLQEYPVNNLYASPGTLYPSANDTTSKISYFNVTPLIETIKETNYKNKADILKKIEVINFLIDDQGADIEMQSHDDNNQNTGTPLAWAVSQGLTDVVALLLKKNAQVNTTDYTGNTPLMDIATMGTKDKEFERNMFEMANLLLKHNANINAINNSHNTALSLALEAENPRVALWLFQRSANISITDINTLIAAIKDMKNDAESCPEEQQQYVNLLNLTFEDLKDPYRFPKAGISFLSQNNQNFIRWFTSGASTQNLSSKDALEFAKNNFSRKNPIFFKLLPQLKKEHLYELLSTLNDAQIIKITNLLIKNLNPEDTIDFLNSVILLGNKSINFKNKNTEILKNIYVHAAEKRKRSITKHINKLIRPKLMDAQYNDAGKERLITEIQALQLPHLLKAYMVEFVKTHGTQKGAVWKDAILELEDDDFMAVYNAAQSVKLLALTFIIEKSQRYKDMFKNQKRSLETETSSSKKTKREDV